MVPGSSHWVEEGAEEARKRRLSMNERFIGP
jgi:hypothetical protein